MDAKEREKLIKKIIGPKSKISWYRDYKRYLTAANCYSEESILRTYDGKELEIVRALQELPYNEASDIVNEAEEITRKYRREQLEKASQSYKKGRKKKEEIGKEVIASSKVGDFIEVRDAKGNSRIMEIMEIEGADSILGRYYKEVLQENKDEVWNIPKYKYYKCDWYWDGKTLEKTNVVTSKLSTYINKKLENVIVI